MDVIKPIPDAELANAMFKEYYILWEVKGSMLIFKNSLTGKEVVFDNNEVKLSEIKLNGLYWINKK